MRPVQSRFTIKRMMIAVAVLAAFLAGSIASYRWCMRSICWNEVLTYRDRAERAGNPAFKAENEQLAAIYERRWRSYGGGR